MHAGPFWPPMTLRFPMIFGKATKVADGFVGGWADAYRVARCSARNGQSVLVNAHGEALDFWEGLGWWWVEEHELAPERDTAKDLEGLFGNSNSTSCVDSDSITFKSGGNQVASFSNGGALVTGTQAPSMQLTITPTDQVTGVSIDEWLDATEHSALKITAPRATGRWDWERVVLETTRPPHPIRRTLISILIGAKWTPYSSKHETKYYGYLRLTPNPAYLTQKT